VSVEQFLAGLDKLGPRLEHCIGFGLEGAVVLVIMDATVGHGSAWLGGFTRGSAVEWSILFYILSIRMLAVWP
jgi:hypothetical protein